MTRRPSVLFVCAKNGGKSQMAAGLMRQLAGDRVDVYSAGTKPGTAVNTLSAESLGELGIDISDQTPKPVDPQRLVRDDIAARVRQLAEQLSTASSTPSEETVP